MPVTHMCPLKAMKQSDNTASTITTDTWAHDSEISAGLHGLYTEDMPQYTKKTSRQPVEAAQRRGGILFQECSEYELHPIKYSNAKKSCMKVSSLEDSLRSCQLHKEQEQKPKRRSSLNLESLTASLRNLIHPPAPRGCVSCSGGMDRQDTEETDDTMASSCSSLVVEKETKVRFSEICCRLYPVAPDDNPSTSKGAAIALSGWQYSTEEAIAVEDYEASRGPNRKRMEDLKIDWMERRRRLLEAGASSSELQAFARRIHKARVQRQETAQAFSLYGKQHLVRLERREKFGHFLKRAVGLRKTNSKNQAALWDQAQEEFPAIKSVSA